MDNNIKDCALFLKNYAEKTTKSLLKSDFSVLAEIASVLLDKKISDKMIFTAE